MKKKEAISMQRINAEKDAVAYINPAITPHEKHNWKNELLELHLNGWKDHKAFTWSFLQFLLAGLRQLSLKPRVTSKSFTSFWEAGYTCSFMNSNILEVTEKLPLNLPALQLMIYQDLQVRNKTESILDIFAF